MINLNLSVKEKVRLLASHFEVREIEVVQLAGIPAGSWRWTLENPHTAGSHMKRELVDNLFVDCMENWSNTSYLKDKLKQVI